MKAVVLDNGLHPRYLKPGEIVLYLGDGWSWPCLCVREPTEVDKPTDPYRQPYHMPTVVSPEITVIEEDGSYTVTEKLGEHRLVRGEWVPL